MCFVDAAMIFYPIATFALVFTGIKLWRKYKETKEKPNGNGGSLYEQESAL